MFLAGAKHHKMKPRARSEGMPTRRGVWQVAPTPPDRYAAGMGVPAAPAVLSCACGRWGGDLGRTVFRPHLMAAGVLGGGSLAICGESRAARPWARGVEDRTRFDAVRQG